MVKSTEKWYFENLHVAILFLIGTYLLKYSTQKIVNRRFLK